MTKKAPLVACLALLACPLLQAAEATPHNVVLFVADGLRPGVVTPETAPTILGLVKTGVRFTNTHSMFPTFTTANASAIATGHKIGDTGDFSNTIYVGGPVNGSLTPFLENDPVLGEVDARFSGDYMNQDTTMKLAHTAGISTAVIGKLGPALIFDHTDRDAARTIVIDDQTGSKEGIPLAPEIQARLSAAKLPLETPSRGANSKSGDFKTPGSNTPNTEQQDYFVAAATKAVLPLLKERGKPFLMVFWSRDPDGTQHTQGDSLGRLVPGVNGTVSRAAIRNADNDLAALLAAIKAQGLEATTDVIVTADHGFSTVSKESATSPAAARSYPDVAPNMLPPGFVALDLAQGLGLKLFDADKPGEPVADGQHASRGNALLGDAVDQPKLIVAANGGSDLIYIPGKDRALTQQVVGLLSRQDYVSGIFVADELGPIQGTLPLSAIDLIGSSVTPLPSILVSFRSFSTGCAEPLACGVEIADTTYQQGQGMHGSFSRADTSVITGAIGPDFKRGFEDAAPISNADVGRTIAALLHLKPADKGHLLGRVLTEAMPNGKLPSWKVEYRASDADELGHRTALSSTLLGTTRYFGAAGYPGRTLGLTADVAAK